MLSSAAATDVAPFEAELRSTFGAALAELPVRAMQFARGAARAAGRDEAFERALAVARLLLVQGADPETIAAAVVSQAIPERDLDLEAVQAAFGPELTALLRGLARAGRIESLNATGTDLEQLRKMLLAIAEDVRVVLIKLAERVVYLRSLTKADEALRRAAGTQTLELFAPLANRLGVSDMKWELEDFAFRYTEPDLYRKIAQLLDEKRSEREAYIQRVIDQLHGELQRDGHPGDDPGTAQAHLLHLAEDARQERRVRGPLRHPRGARDRAQRARVLHGAGRRARPLDAGRGRVRRLHRAIPRPTTTARCTPRWSGPRARRSRCRSAPTRCTSTPSTASRPTGATRKARRADKAFDAKIAWLRQVLAWKHEVLGGEVSDKARRGLFEDTIYVLTPQGRVVDLPAGSTPIDFAYHVHTDLGHRCRGAKVDGQMVPLNYKLANAQRVEIMAAKQGGPSRDWLSPQQGYLASPRAMAKVRQWFRHEDFEKDVASGRSALDKELHRIGAVSESHEQIAAACGFPKLEDFLAALGRGEVTSRQIEIAVRGEAPQQQPAAPAPCARRGEAVVRRAGAGCQQHRHDDREVLQAGAARSHRGIRHPRARRDGAPPGLRERHGPRGEPARAPHAGRLGQDRGGGAVLRRPGGGRDRPPGPAARRERGHRPRAHQRDRGEHALARGPCIHALHRAGRQRRRDHPRAAPGEGRPRRRHGAAAVRIATLKDLEARLNEPLPVHERVRLLNGISEALYERDAARGADLAREAVALARASGDLPGEAQACYCLGRNLHSLGDYPGVLEAQDTAVALFRAQGDLEGEARCRNLLGITWRQLSDYGRALEMYESALKGFREVGDLKWQARVISNIGNIEIQLGNHTAALELFDQALDLRRQTGDNEGAGFDLNNAAFGHVQRALQLRAAGDMASCQLECESALKLLDRALEVARQYGYKRLEAICLQTMGEAYLAMARPEVALGMADQFLALARESGDPWIEAYGLSCVGEIRHQLGQEAEAMELLGRALAAFEALGSRDETARVLRILSQAHEVAGDLTAALACLRRSAALEQQLKSEDTERRARALAARRRVEHAAEEAERYRRLAMEDSLTGLPNRRQLDEQLGAMMREARERGSVVTLALADVDHFKGINDRFSHAVGDEVLRCVGEILRAHCRSGDIAGRYGGEEFVLVFRGLDMRAASEACERVRHGVEAFDWHSIHPQLRVTLSMGLAASSSFDHPQGLLDAADHWLYEAKHHGRNQIQPLVFVPASA